MPSTAAPPAHSGGIARADIVLGDRYGSTSSAAITGCLEELFNAKGLSVVRNKPYSGGFITQSYGRPRDGLHAVQVEINRGLYADERKIRPIANFAPLRAVLEDVLGRFLAALPDLFAPRVLAAE
jgi:N-formylglutamate amidohydrolase